MLTHRFLQLTTKLCTNFSQKIPAVLEACAAEFFESECIPIGIPGLKIEKAQLFAKEKHLQKPRYGGDFAQATTTLQKECARVKKIEEFFEQRVFGKKIWPYCKRVKGKTYHNQPIYEVIEKIDYPHLKKGQVFYLDGFHMNHLEVFGGSGSKKYVTAVINLDGSYNEIKTIKAINQNRTLNF